MLKVARLALAVVAAGFVASAGGPARAQTRGVTESEIRFGSLIDTSGPIAQYGKNQRNGMLMRVEEINAAGGLHGRKIRLIVEDSGYDPRKAVLGAQKLVERDEIFAAVGVLGTPVMNAALPVFMDAKVMHAFPLSGGRLAFEPVHPLRFAFASSYVEQAKAIVKAMNAKRADRVWCTLYQDDDLGLEVLTGAEAGLKALGKTFTDKTSYKRGATEFSSQIARMKNAKCDTVLLGTTLRETIGAMGEARKTGFTPEFTVTASAYTQLVPKLGGAIVEDLIIAHTLAEPASDDSPRVREWAARYKQMFNEEPDAFSAMGYSVIDWTSAGVEKAGKALSNEAFTKAMESMTFTNNLFGSDDAKFSPTQHLGSTRSRFSQVKNGRLVVISDYVSPD